MDKITELRSRNDELRAEIESINTEYAGQALPDDAASKWNDFNTEVDRNEKLITELEARSERIASLSGSDENREEGVSFNTRRANATHGEDIWDLSTIRSSISDPAAQAREVKDRAKRAIDQATFASSASREATQEHVSNLVENADGENAAVSMRIMQTGSPVYRAAFKKALAGGHLSNEEQRALSLTGESGGFAVPFTLDPTVIATSNGVVNPLRRISRVEQITGNTWKGITSSGVSAAYAAEAVEASDNAPTLAQPEVTVAKAQAFIPFSIEVGQDWSGLESEMGKMLSDAKDKLEAEKFLSGSGSNVPQGVLTGATTEVETGTTATFAVADLYKVEENLPPRFRPNAQFVANRAVYNKVRQFDTAGGANLWVFLQQAGAGNSPTGNIPYQLLGYPANELSTMSSEATTTGQKTILFGDFSNFLIVDRIGMNVELLPLVVGSSGRPTGQRGLYAYWRNGSKVLTSAAFRVLKVK